MPHRRFGVDHRQLLDLGDDVGVEAEQPVERALVAGDGLSRGAHRSAMLIGENGGHDPFWSIPGQTPGPPSEQQEPAPQVRLWSGSSANTV